MINEGINDPAIFKAVFLAGGPGSGKSFIVGKSALIALGFKLVNSDDAFEAALKNAKMEATPENIYSDRGQILRARAKELTAKKKRGYLEGRLGLIIDGTGKDYDKIKGQVGQLKSLGYDVSMIFVNTNIDSALSRNRMRSRSLPDDKVSEMWRSVQNNMGKFQRLFGRDMHLIDNSEGHDYERDVMATYKYLVKWSNLPPKNNIASTWIAAERAKKGITEMTDSKTKMLQKALNAITARMNSKKGSIEDSAFEISKSFNLGLSPRQLASLYREKFDLNKKTPTAQPVPVRFKKYTVSEASAPRSIDEEGGAGDEGTAKLRKKYQKDVPHEPVKDYVKEAMTSREGKKEYDRIQIKLAPLAQERNAAKKRGQPWKLMDTREKEYQNLRVRLRALEEETTTADIPDPKDTAQGPKFKMTNMVDRRRKKNQPPVLLKKYRRDND